jgi:DNA repair exonuclease SbcCD ATPase subunit
MSATRTTRERRLAKAAQLREWADARDAKADAAYERVQSITDRRPFGQPILVGHHSERGARADQRRIDGGMSAYLEHRAKAAEMRARADNIEAAAASAIYSDDADAIDRLSAKIANLESRRDAMKAANGAYRKAHRSALKNLTAYERDRAVPHPSYEIRNLTAEVGRNRKRLDELRTPEVGRWLVTRFASDCRICQATVTEGQRALYFRRTRAIECEDCAS